MEDELRQIHNQLRTAQDKYTYFLLAICASAIAFSVQATKTETISYSLLPLGLAVACWGGSFFAGCRSIQYVNSTLYANLQYLKVKSGNLAEVGNNPHYIQAASEGIMQAMESNSNVCNSYSTSQFRLAIFGGILFVLWHIVKMWVRSTNSS